MSKKNKTDIEVALELCNNGMEFFHDQNHETFVYFNGNSFPLNSKEFRREISIKYNMHFKGKKALGTEILNQLIPLLEGKALSGPQYSLYVRVGKIGDAFAYDLGNQRIVIVEPGNWKIISNWNSQGIYNPFKSFPHQVAQKEPISGDPWQLFNYINVPKKLYLLIMVYTISCLIPEIPHPILHCYGLQGTGKTRLCGFLKDLIDPSSVENLITPNNQSDLIQVFSHHHFTVLDNLSDLSKGMADFLAKIVTGTGFSKRKLYTDDREVIYNLKRAVCINGIPMVITRPDLMERAILIPLEQIKAKKRKTESELMKAFEQAKPTILGGMFDALSKAMANYSTLNLEKLPRMADFAKWGNLIAEALGEKGSDFIKAYSSNQKIQNSEVVKNDTLAQAVISLMGTNDKWEGTVKEAFKALKGTAQPDREDNSFPVSSNKLRGHLERIKVTLEAEGIKVTIGGRKRDGVPISFKRKKDKKKGEDIQEHES
jgi:hypothetical protein